MSSSHSSFPVHAWQLGTITQDSVYNRLGLSSMKFELTMEDFTIIQNALHYYKKVDKRGNFQQYNKERINNLRDKLSHQIFSSEE